VATAGQANISHHADEPTARDKHPEAVLPNLIQLVVESLVICDKP
jgi:hypothetical protein